MICGTSDDPPQINCESHFPSETLASGGILSKVLNTDHVNFSPNDHLWKSWKLCRITFQLEHMQCFTHLIVTALKKAGIFASNRNIYYKMIDNRTIGASSK